MSLSAVLRLWTKALCKCKHSGSNLLLRPSIVANWTRETKWMRLFFITRLYVAFCLSSYMGQTAGQSRGQMHGRSMLLISNVSTNAARYQLMAPPICSKRRGPEANGTTQTHCNSPVTSPDPFWAHCAYGRQHRCQEDPVNSSSRGLEETSRTHHMAEHHTAGSEIPQSHTAWSNGYGPELVSVEDVVDVWRYAILSCMPETTTTTLVRIRQFYRCELLVRMPKRYWLVPVTSSRSLGTLWLLQLRTPTVNVGN